MSFTQYTQAGNAFTGTPGMFDMFRGSAPAQGNFDGGSNLLANRPVGKQPSAPLPRPSYDFATYGGGTTTSKPFPTTLAVAIVGAIAVAGLVVYKMKKKRR